MLGSGERSQMVLVCREASGPVFFARIVGTLRYISCGVVVVQVQVLMPMKMKSDDPGYASFQSAEIHLIYT